MVNIYKRIKRPDGHGRKGKLPLEEIDFLKLLKQHFRYIYKSLLDEYPFIELTGKYNLLKEVVINKEVVGFSLYSFKDDIAVEEMYLEYYYVLPEFREEFSLYDEIFEASEYGIHMVFLHNPRRETIELLIKERKACMLDERFVLSHFDLVYDVAPKKITFKKSIRNSCELRKMNEVKQYQGYTDIYDLELCTVVPTHFLSNKESPEDLKLSVAYEDEDKKYNCIEKRNNEKLIEENQYLTASCIAFNNFMEIHGNELCYDLRE